MGNFLGVEITDSSSIFLYVLYSFHNNFRLILLLILFKTNIAKLSGRLDICDGVILHILTVLYRKVSLDAETFRSQSLWLWMLIKPLVNEIHAELRLILLVYVVLLLRPTLVDPTNTTRYRTSSADWLGAVVDSACVVRCYLRE